MHTVLDSVWLAICILLVLSMQGGFLLLEAGRVRSKNSISVAQKNISELVVTWSAYFVAGYWLMFGVATPFGRADVDAVLKFLYQLGFCATAASIVSGAVAERMTFRAYLYLATVVSLLIYPVVGRWVWGGLSEPLTGSWLAHLGFIDFAGSTVVHVTGAAVSLAAVLAIGPRLGRFDQHGLPQPMHGHNAVISLFGTLVLLVGWFGFNGGGLPASDPRFAQVLLNTAAAACFGALAGMVLGVTQDRGVFNPGRIISGLLGGLVAVTASAHFAAAWQASLIGVVGGLLATWGSDWLPRRWRIDDPADAIATHGLAGIAGTLAVAWVSPLEMLPAGSRLQLLAVQALGVTAVFLFAFLAARLLLTAARPWLALRVSALDEQLGMNHTEHGESLGTDRLKRALDARLERSGAFADHFDTGAGDDSAELAHAMNQLLDRHEAARESLRESQRRFADFAHTASDWLWESDALLNVTYLSVQNGADVQALQSTLLGHPLINTLRIRREDQEVVQRQSREMTTITPFEAALPMPDGSTLLVEVRAVPYVDAGGRFIGYRGTVNDITVRRSAEKRAMFLSRHDELTGLANRRALADDLASAIAQVRSQSKGLVVAALDLDGFKGVNDAWGHPTGDAVLLGVAQRLGEQVRSQDRVYRIGGDEFVILMAGFDLASLEQLGVARCTEICEAMGLPFAVEGKKIELGASLGLAFFPAHGSDAESLVRMADLALYAAKADGKGRIRVFEAGMDANARDQAALENDLREAVRNEQLFLEYQPQYDSADGRLACFEALVRWQHPSRGRVGPDRFIPIAERTNLIGTIGRFVLMQACALAAGWPDTPDGQPVRIAVNVSPVQFRDGLIVGDVRDALVKSGLPASRLELEITEEVLIEDLERVRAVLLDLRAIGVSIAVDDFGSGQASLRYLSQFPINKLKIDRSFVRRLGLDDRADDIAQSIVMLGHRLGCVVVAEGVEEMTQAALLRAWNCDQIQGFAFARPMPADAVLRSFKPASMALAVLDRT